MVARKAEETFGPLHPIYGSPCKLVIAEDRQGHQGRGLERVTGIMGELWILNILLYMAMSGADQIG